MDPVSLSFWDYAAMLFYLAVTVLIGIKFSKNENSSEDYFLGGRRLPWLAVGISILMSYLSTYSMVLVPGEIYSHGLSMWVIYSISPIFGIFAFMIFIRFYFKLGSFTPFEYIEVRYNRVLRGFVAAMWCYSKFLYLGMILFSTAKIFEGAAGIAAWKTIVIVGIIGTVYTVLGGMKAVVWTDVFQFIILTGGLIFALVILCAKLDYAPISAVKYAFEHGRGFNGFDQAGFYTLNPYVRLTFWLLIYSAIIGPFGSAASDQVTVQRYLSTGTYRGAFKSMLSSLFMQYPFKLIIWFLGLGIFTYYSLNPDSRVTSGDTAFFTFVSTFLPTPIPGLILAAMLAAAMSSLDSVINSLSAVWVKEIHEKYISPNLSNKESVSVARWVTGITGITAVAIALCIGYSTSFFGQSLVEALTIFGIFDVFSTAAFFIAIFSKRATSKLIWTMAMFQWGLKIGVLTWYSLSTRALKVWAPGEELGFAGPLPLIWVIIPLITIIVFYGATFLFSKEFKRKFYLIKALPLIPGGVFVAITLWYIFSNLLIVDIPKAVSFQWIALPGIISFYLFAFIGIQFCKVQPREKYQGLTWNTRKETVIGEEVNSGT